MTKRKALTLVVCFLMIALFAVGGTIAWVMDKTGKVENVFEPAKVTCAIEESFDGTVKKDVNVKNTGNVNAYLRVRLVTYRVNAAGQRIGGTAEIPEFVPGTDWEKSGEYYYYMKPVAPGEFPANPLIGNSGITLEDSYSDPDAGKQVIEVVAEAIQAEGMGASTAQEAWTKAKAGN